MNLDLDKRMSENELVASIMAAVDMDKLKHDIEKCEAQRINYYELTNDGPNVWYHDDVALLDNPSKFGLNGHGYGVTMLDRFLEHFNFDPNLVGNTVHVVGTDRALYPIFDALTGNFVTNNNLIIWMQIDDSLQIATVVYLK